MRFYSSLGNRKRRQIIIQIVSVDYTSDMVHEGRAPRGVAWVGYLPPAWLLALLNEARTRADRRPPSVVVRDRSRGDPTVVQQAPEAV